ncbi:hypothetical protein QN277_026349 [Acacia crassicarpa]|uniref:Uncharacterized protein n=1 Tax=Acacia crassicarpa TaxID=499986 RepID=A0AAE1JA40_9FABA|nr:hypothetical protein QN277_026349 [Acacia crassicarpa]
MEVSALSFVERRIWMGSLIEALAVETVFAAGNCLVWLLKVTEYLLADVNHSVSPKFTRMDGRFPLDELVRGKQAFVECKDGSDDDDDEDDQDEEDANDQEDDDDAGDEDFSGEGEEEADPEDDPEANGAGGSDDGEDDDDEDGDEDDEEDGEEDDEEEEEEDEDDEEVPQPPAKKRK